MELAIDINCDLGEGYANDAELMRYISSANIACGYHAGDADTMKRTVDLALVNGVAIGAHPGYHDREYFGRKAMSLTAPQIRDIVTTQIHDLGEIAEAAGARLAHVKPHGALYNQAARDREIASAIAEAVLEFNRNLILFGLSGSFSISEAAKLGLQTASEVFADRTYQTDGTLTPRTEPNALIKDADAAITQVLDMIKYGRVRSVEAIMVPITADTVCIHGDGENAVEFAIAIRNELRSNAIEIRSIC
ncbi:MAG TPA: 5-oxoprolinase subunit PxpA [Pyrinomonadaceae bacterium]|nr:5-oxoprolinase subunit PxpA [Pyrinomonadaceae bacterium]